MVTGLIHPSSWCSQCHIPVHTACAAELPASCSLTDVYNSGNVIEVPLVDLYNSRGLAYYHNSMYREAIEDFNSGLNLIKDPEGDQAAIFYANRGLAHFYLDDLDNCIIDFSKALSLEYFSPQIYEIRANAYQLQGRFIAFI